MARFAAIGDTGVVVDVTDVSDPEAGDEAEYLVACTWCPFRIRPGEMSDEFEDVMEAAGIHADSHRESPS